MDLELGIEMRMEGAHGRASIARASSPLSAKGPGRASSSPPSEHGKHTKPRGSGSRSTAGKIKVLLVDDHLIVRQAIANLLEDAADIVVIAEAADGNAAVEAARALKPDVVVMDVNMPRMDGVQAARAIIEEQSTIKIIGLSIRDDNATRQAMLAAGACAYLRKDGPAEVLIDTIRGSR